MRVRAPSSYHLPKMNMPMNNRNNTPTMLLCQSSTTKVLIAFLLFTSITFFNLSHIVNATTTTAAATATATTATTTITTPNSKHSASTEETNTNNSSNGANGNSRFYLSSNETAQHYALINGSSTLYSELSITQLSSGADLKVNNFNVSTTIGDSVKSATLKMKTSSSSSNSGGSGIFDFDAELTVYEKHLERSSVIFGLTKVANASSVNPFCFAQLKHLQSSILRKEPWAMKVLDASGTKPSGFVFGQNFWLGSREACGAVRKPVEITLSRNYERVMHYALITDKAPFDIDYRVIYLRHNSPWQVEIKLMSEQIIHIGLCLPSACPSTEIQQLTTEYVMRGLFVENDIYDIQPEVMYMKDLKLSERFYERPSFKLLTALLTFTGAAMLLASHMRVRALAEAEERKGNAMTDKDEHCMPAHEPLLVLPQFFVNAVEQVKDFARCFDIIANFERILATKPNLAKEIPVINGLRSISAIWIMIFHVFWFMYFTVNNKPFLISFAERFALQYISSAPLLVDVFFTISGFLQTYNFLSNTKQMEEVRRNTFRQNALQFGKMLFHRYLRLAPLYLTVMGMVDLFYAYIADVSVFHLNEPFDEYCSRYWWRNVFFIQNFYDHNNMCLNWTWSLACEMQYFILATILLITYAKRPKLVKGIVMLLLTATVGWSFIIGVNSKFQLSFDAFFSTGNQIYISPFVRILPYILGACVAWALREKFQSQFEISEMQEKCLWNLSILIFLSCLYSTIWRDLSTLLCTALFIVGRFAFSLCVCWMIVGSATGRGVWWSRILEAKVFQHINRLSYAIYLLNPFVVAFFFSLNNSSTHADPFMLCILSTGFVVIVYLTSIVFSLGFEVPYCNWSSKLQRRSRQKIN